MNSNNATTSNIVKQNQLSKKLYYTHREKKIQAIHNGVDIQDRLPILTQNVQAHIPLQVNIRMVNLTCYQYEILEVRATNNILAPGRKYKWSSIRTPRFR